MRVAYREEPARAALTRVQGMPFRWSLNPYTGCVHQCTFCYVRGFELRAGRPSDDRYGASIRVKVNLLDLLPRELARKSWQHEQVAIGSATDPYQPAEGRYRLTRGAVQVLAESGTPFSIVTRGPLVVRDVDVLTDATARVDVSVNISIPTLDERIWRTTEPHTSPPRQRLRALRTLVDAGIHAGVGMAPILPGLSDDPAKLREVVLAARESGARFLWWNVLNLRPGTKEHFLGAPRSRLARAAGGLPASLRESGVFARAADGEPHHDHECPSQPVDLGAAATRAPTGCCAPMGAPIGADDPTAARPARASAFRLTR